MAVIIGGGTILAIWWVCHLLSTPMKPWAPPLMVRDRYGNTYVVGIQDPDYGYWYKIATKGSTARIHNV